MASRARGITLIELLVVIAIISVMLSVVGPPVSAGLDNIALTTTSQRALAAFRSAQNAARSTGQRVYATHGENDIRFVRADRVYQTLVMPAGVRVVTSPQTAAFIFLESGEVIGPDALDLFNARGRRMSLSINHARGSFKLAKGQDSQ